MLSSGLVLIGIDHTYERVDFVFVIFLVRYHFVTMFVYIGAHENRFFLIFYEMDGLNVASDLSIGVASSHTTKT